jgi:hypothetical protein
MAQGCRHTQTGRLVCVQVKHWVNLYLTWRGAETFGANLVVLIRQGLRGKTPDSTLFLPLLLGLKINSAMIGKSRTPNKEEKQEEEKRSIGNISASFFNRPLFRTRHTRPG